MQSSSRGKFPKSSLAAEMQEFRESLQQLVHENVALEARIGKTLPELTKATHDMKQSYDGLTDARSSAHNAHALFEEALEKRADSEKQLAAAFIEKHDFLQLQPTNDLSSRARVAACLMVKPRLLQECRNSVRAYLLYHLTSNGGPTLDHIFMFLDATEASHASGNRELARHFNLGWLFEGPFGTELESRLSLMQCRSVMPIECRTTVEEELSTAHEAARGGELIAKQIINSESALRLCVERQIDWLICNLDIDEAMASSFNIGTLLASVSPDVWQVTFLNHEAVPEFPSSDEYFTACTLFKKNPTLLDIHGKSNEQTQCIKFWKSRIKIARDDLDPSTSLHKASHFLAYVNGKSAVHVASAMKNNCYAAGSHRWRRKAQTQGNDDIQKPEPSQDPPVVDPACVAILHYVNCEGLSGFVQKCNARREEKWNPIPFHYLCQRAACRGYEALQQLYENTIVMEDAAAAEQQVSAGVCLRITCVRDALLSTTLDTIDIGSIDLSAMD